MSAKVNQVVALRGNGVTCTLYHADCMDLLPIEADAVVTDPPYGLGELWNGGAGGEKSSWRIPPEEAKRWDGDTVLGLPDLISAYREAIVWGGNYYNLPPSRCWLIWDKKQSDTWTTGQAELAWTNLDKPTRMFRMAQCEAHMQKQMIGSKVHPAQKPIDLMRWCLKWVASQVIFDPFMGSGTTGIACIRSGRNFIGVEKDAKYFEIAVERIRRELSQKVLF